MTVTNTGSRRSREAVQVYFRPAAPDQPVRLVGWTRVVAAPGESVQARVDLDSRMWRRWNPETHGWGVLRSGGQLILARGLGDVRASLSLPES